MNKFLKAAMGTAALLAFGAALAIPAFAEEAAPDLRNAKCPMTGKPTAAKHFVAYADAEKEIFARVHFCCPNCVKGAANADLKELYTKAYLTKADGSKVEYGKTVLDLKNEVCPVGGDKTEGAGILNYNAAAVHICCPSCNEELVKNPDKYLPKLKAEIAKAQEEANKAAEKN